MSVEAPLTILHGAFPWRQPSQPAQPPPAHLLTKAEEEEPWPDWPDAVKEEGRSLDELDAEQKAVVEAFKVPRVEIDSV